jgi:hypothetical protein
MLGTVTLTYDLEGRAGTADFVPNPQVSGEANVDTLAGIGFVWGKSVYDKRGVIPSLGVPGPAAVVSLALSNTSSYLILGPYMQFPTTLSGFRVDYPTAADAAPLELGDPDVPNGGIGATGVYPTGGWQRWVYENDGGLYDTGNPATNWTPSTTDHGWASSYIGQDPSGGLNTNEATDAFLSEYDSVAADKTFTIRFLELDPAIGVAKTWGPLYDEDGDIDTFGPHSTAAHPGFYAQPDAVPPNPVACAVPMRFQQMPNGETPTRVIIQATLYADALVDARAVFGAPKNARWDALKTSIGGFDSAADVITSVARDSGGDILVGWLDSSAGAAPGQFMFQFSRLGSDLTMENSATIPIVSGLRTVAGAANVRGFSVNTTRNRAFVAVDSGGGTGTVFSFDATTGAQAAGGAGMDVAAQQGIGAFSASCRVSSILADEANGIVYVAYGDGAAAPATIARVIGYGLDAGFVPTTQVCASPPAGIALFRQGNLPPPLPGGNLLEGGDLGVDGSGRVFVSSGTNVSPNGIVRLVRSGAALNLDTIFDMDTLTTVPAVPPSNQTYDLFAVNSAGAVTAYITGPYVPRYRVDYSPDLPGDNGPRVMRDASFPDSEPGLVHFTAAGTWNASTWMAVETGAGDVAGLFVGFPVTAMFQAGDGPLGTQKSVLIRDGGLGADAQIAFVNM